MGYMVAFLVHKEMLVLVYRGNHEHILTTI